MKRDQITFGSVCSGIEAASVAWAPLGWQAAWLSEIEAFPSAVLAHHYPHVPNLGDMNRIPQLLRNGDIPAPDVFCGGTPCQAFSIAGLRNSLDDARGNLSLKYCDIADEIDIQRRATGLLPCVAVWENVPGVLSTKDNAFGCFLGQLAGESCALVAPGGKWPNAGVVVGPKRAVAWRVLDAQYFGVAQRRRRVFVVASAREGFDPAAVLFEFDGVRRDSAPSRDAGQDPAAATLRSTDGGSDVDHALGGHLHAVQRPGSGELQHVTGTLSVGGKASGSATQQDAHSDLLVPVARSVALRGREGGATAELGDDLAGCLRASGGGGDKAHVLAPIAFDRRQDCVSSTEVFGALGLSSPQAQAVSYAIQAGALRTNPASGPDGVGVQEQIAYTLEARAEVQAVAFSCKDYGADASVELAPTMRAMGHTGSHANAGGQLAVCFAENSRGELRLEGGDGQRTGCLSTGGGKPGQGTPMVAVTYPIQNALRGAGQNGLGVGAPADPMYTLDLGSQHAVCVTGDACLTAWDSQQKRVYDASAAAFSPTLSGSDGAGGRYPPAYLVPADGASDREDGAGLNQPIVPAYSTKLHDTTSNQAGKIFEEYTVALDANSPPPALLTAMAVRRLTPRECERLQGFEDDYTKIPTWNGWRKLDVSESPEQLQAEGLEVKQNRKTGKWRVKDVDGPRYKALGNSWAIPNVRAIGRRIDVAIRANFAQERKIFGRAA